MGRRYDPGMHSILRAAAAAIALALLSACATPVPERPIDRGVLLVSVDGLGADMLDPSAMPRVTAMADAGVRAEWMAPSYPVLTFPNHYTLVTGLRPDRHGLVHNTMEDAALGRFTKNASADSDARWWNGGVPVWVSAERAGLPTATHFWPGSETTIHGIRPTRWLSYDEDISSDARVDTVLGWLSEPPATRPRFATLYFSLVDDAAHGHGPRSAAMQAALREVDAAIGRLLDGLAARGLADTVDVVLVSDHGLVEVPPGHVLSTDAMVDPGIARAVTTGQVVGFAPLPGQARAAEARLLGRHTGYACWRREALPARWEYGRHPRVPPIVCQMEPGWDALEPERLAWRDPDATRGSHGYDPALPSMRAVFIASGPSFREGVVLPPIDNVDVYPLLMRLLGLAPEPNDGDAEATAGTLMSESGE